MVSGYAWELMVEHNNYDTGANVVLGWHLNTV